jgi:hypothetical protein
MLIFGERHLRTILTQYNGHYNGRLPHRSRQLRPSRPDHPVADLFRKRTKRRPVLDGLTNEYEPVESLGQDQWPSSGTHNLVPQHEQLGVLGGRRPAEQNQPAAESDEDEIEQA